MKPVDRLLGEIVLEVVLLTVLGFGDADDLLVLGDQRVILPGLPAEEPPEVIEPEPGRPAVERPGEPLLVIRSQMPLPEPSRQIAVLLEDARKRRAIARDGRVVPRERTRELAHHAEADPVVVAPRQQRRPGRRAQRRDVKAVVAQPVLRQPGVVRGLDRTAERARVAEAGVVDQNEKHIRRTLGRLDVARLAPVGLRALERPLRRALERRPPDRKLRSIRRAHQWFSRQVEINGLVWTTADNSSEVPDAIANRSGAIPKGCEEPRADTLAAGEASPGHPDPGRTLSPTGAGLPSARSGITDLPRRRSGRT